jgi:hypothetical protein
MDENKRIELANERKDLGGRLYYCSNSGEGKKIRKELEKRIKEINKLIGD